MTKTLVSLISLACTACAYHLPIPKGFDAEPVGVTGPSYAMNIGDWRVTNVDRTNSGGANVTSKTPASAQRRQRYRFNAVHESGSSLVQCTFDRRGPLSLVGPNNWVTEDETLSCSMSGNAQGVIDLANDPETKLVGRIDLGDQYRVTGVSVPGSPVTGFYIEDNGEVIATVQITGERRVMFARNVMQRQRDALMPAIAALLLFDEHVREM